MGSLFLPGNGLKDGRMERLPAAPIYCQFSRCTLSPRLVYTFLWISPSCPANNTSRNVRDLFVVIVFNPLWSTTVLASFSNTSPSKHFTEASVLWPVEMSFLFLFFRSSIYKVFSEAESLCNARGCRTLFFSSNACLQVDYVSFSLGWHLWLYR